MKVIVQVVKCANVKVDEKINGEIEKGYMLLVGFNLTDTSENVKKMAKKVANLRIFEDEFGKLNLSIKDIGGKILSISQFTIYGDCQKGNRPSFTNALNGEKAEPLYNEFNELLEKEYELTVEKGVFGAHMEVMLINEGPATIILEN